MKHKTLSKTDLQFLFCLSEFTSIYAILYSEDKKEVSRGIKQRDKIIKMLKEKL